MSWITTVADGVIVVVKATPRSKKNEIVGVDNGEWLRVRLKAPPVDGKANAALAEFFAKAFGCSKNSVTVVSGTTARIKRVKINGLALEDIRSKIEET